MKGVSVGFWAALVTLDFMMFCEYKECQHKINMTIIFYTVS